MGKEAILPTLDYTAVTDYTLSTSSGVGFQTKSSVLHLPMGGDRGGWGKEDRSQSYPE